MTQVIVIGASAGGLKPLECFFENAKSVANTCFIVIQHLSPDHVSHMPEILARRTKLKIKTIQSGDTIAPGCLYLNSPDSVVEVHNGVFNVIPFKRSQVQPLRPIDHIMNNLAAQVYRPVAGVILSGTGSDGAAGLKALADIGAPIFIQDPDEAEFPAMPRTAQKYSPSAVAAPAAKLPQRVQAALAHATDDNVVINDTEQQILNLFRSEYNLNFQDYKLPTLYRRIERRKKLRGIATLPEYLHTLESNSTERKTLLEDLLIGVTEFHRDGQAFEALRNLVIPNLLDQSKNGREIRVWVPACATGQEAYSIAIELFEAFINNKLHPNFRIIATDVFKDSIKFASLGTYSTEACASLPQHIKDKYFFQGDDGYTVSNSLRQKVIFSTHNAIIDPPFSDLDLVSCRNFLIYLTPEAQAQVIARLEFGLRSKGYLFLGSSEALGNARDNFEDISTKWRIFQKIIDHKSSLRNALRLGERRNQSDVTRYLDNVPPSRPPLDLIVQSQVEALSETSVTQKQFSDARKRLFSAYDALLKRYAPSSILINANGEVLTWFGGASLYIDTHNGLVDWFVENIVHPDIQYAINIALKLFEDNQGNRFQRKLPVTMDDGSVHQLELNAEVLSQLDESKPLILVSINRITDQSLTDEDEAAPSSSTDGAEAALLQERITELERELRLTEESLQFVTERLDTKTEQLKSFNEELQASNEELQASNEELQASNEELQAVNEELLAVSREHEAQFEFLNEMRQEQEDVFEQIGFDLIILSESLHLLRYSAGAGRKFGFEPHDIGRSILHVGANLNFTSLDDLAKRALETEKTQTANGMFDGQNTTIEVFVKGGGSDLEGGKIFITLHGELAGDAS